MLAQTAMDPIEQITRAQAMELVDEDGKRVALTVHDGLADEQIAAVEEEYGLPLPGELRRLLAHTRGIDGALEVVDFSGTGGFELLDVFPAGLAIADDGFGNSWVVDLTPAARDVAPVFFACHDPPVILLQSASVGEFLHEVFRLYVPPHASLVDDVHEDRLFNVWGSNPGVLSREQALGGDDEDLARFAAALDDGFAIVDLRAAPAGMGFSWGRHGPRTQLRRHGYERVFAYGPPPRRRGRLRRLLS